MNRKEIGVTVKLCKKELFLNSSQRPMEFMRNLAFSTALSRLGLVHAPARARVLASTRIVRTRTPAHVCAYVSMGACHTYVHACLHPVNAYACTRVHAVKFVETPTHSLMETMVDVLLSDPTTYSSPVRFAWKSRSLHIEETTGIML